MNLKLVIALNFWIITIALSQDSLDISPLSIEFLNKGVTCFTNKNFTCAIEEFNKAIEDSPLYLKAYYNRGNAFLNLKNYDQAIKDYTKCLKIDKNFNKALLYRAYAYSNIKKLDQALADYNELLVREPENTNALSNRATLFIELGHNEKAISDLEKAIASSTKIDPKYLTNRATAEFNLGMYKESLNSLTQAERIESSYKIYELRAKNLIKLENYERAIPDLNACIKLEPNKNDIYYLRGFCRQMSEDLQGAINDYNTHLQNNPKNLKCIEFRGICHYNLKNFAEATSDFTEYLNHENSKSVLFQRANTYLSQNNLSLAKKDFEKVIQLDESFAEAYFNLATIYSKEAKNTEMCQNLKKSFSLGYLKAQEYINTYCK